MNTKYVKKNVKRPITQLFARKPRQRLKHRLSVCMKEEKLRVVEFREGSMTEGEVHFCELEQGIFPGEDDDGDVDGRTIESLMKCHENLEQHVEMMPEESNESMWYYFFKTHDFCVFIGCEKDKVRHSSKIFIKIVGSEDMLLEVMEEEENQNYVVKKDELTSSHKDSPDEDYTQLVNEEEDVEIIMKCSYQQKEMILDETQESHRFKIDH